MYRRLRATRSILPEKIKEGTFVSKKTFHAQPNTIQHWQLRDLISTGSKANEVYYVRYNQTLCYDTQTREARVIQELGYAPTSMTMGHGYLAAGGQLGQLDVYSANEGNSIFSSDVGDNVNNSLHVGKSSAGDPCLLVSNNDCTVKVYDLPSLRRLASVTFPMAINYSAMSSDGKYMVCVGDSEHVYLYSTQGEYQLLNTFSEASDSGMCCAWNASDTSFASASQDGTVCVWDLRMGKLLAKLAAPRSCRAVKFSCGAIDLLTYTEHEGACHIVDARTFQEQQVLTIPQNTSVDASSDISGIAFGKDGTRLYVGAGDQGILEYEVDSIMRRSFSSGGLI
mmetsp:Transcript_27318/g.52001  ORF Transcript_27318/g.52001 Transcript_27318/m.52001 type:complete len:339 (+) Transcript_27318:231-1247(+)